MNTYYEVIAKVIRQLEKNTLETRRQIYDRARGALAAQFEDGSEEMRKESLALEEAIQKVEAAGLGQAPKESPLVAFVEGNADQGNSSGSSDAPRKDAKTADLWATVRPENDEDGGSSRSNGGRAGDESSLHPRIKAVLQAAQFHGAELDAKEFSLGAGETTPSAAALSLWVQNAGMWSRAVRLRWRHLLGFQDNGPIVLLFNDGGAALLTAANVEQRVVFLRNPSAPTSSELVPVDELRLSEVWSGEAVLLRRIRGYAETEAPFNMRWLVGLVLRERQSLRDIALASVTISVLTILPPLLVMTTVNKVLQFHSTSTLILLSAMLTVAIAYEALLGYARRLITAVVGARLDARLNLHVFDRLLRLPLDYFEHNPSGETMYRIAQIYRVREFLTGKLFATGLDLVTLCLLLPLLVYINPILAGIVVSCAIVITLIILAHLGPLRFLYMRVTQAESWKAAALTETIVGIKTVKALALEPQRRAVWDECIAEAGKWRLAFARMANWPETLVTPVERLMTIGTMMIGAYMALNDPSGYLVGTLFAFMLLSQRVAQPLVGLARLVEEHEEINAAISEGGSVLNRPLESASGSAGLRPKLVGAISFDNVTFTYAGSKTPALDRVSFSIEQGTMLGIVGRSGSGKSTITRLLQGLNRDYRGFLKIDGCDLKDIDLRHLRQSFGVVLQSNFLFRGSIRDNIIAGRPGLTFADAVRAARLAGAEEFIERMPNGYQTYIEEGSPNLSGGQCQRLAIARALIHDPRIFILDEATSALDPESEAAVNDNLQRIAQERTMIIVTHRLSSLTDCDQILVMDAGAVADIGSHNVLLERCSIYRQLWTQQNRHLDKGHAGRRLSVAPMAVPSD
jgi:ATP-binding cassette, subfamily B, bacterial HlyB/CyaB